MSFHKADEHQVVTSKILPPAYRSLWIGLSRHSPDWKWEDGSPLSFAQWESGEPNDKNFIEGCVELINGYFYKNSGKIPGTTFLAHLLGSLSAKGRPTWKLLRNEPFNLSGVKI